MDGEKLRQERPIPDEITDLIDVEIDGTPADNELLAWDETAGKFINQTPAEAVNVTDSRLLLVSERSISSSDESYT